jgi:hypothetical protein
MVSLHRSFVVVAGDVMREEGTDEAEEWMYEPDQSGDGGVWSQVEQTSRYQEQ